MTKESNFGVMSRAVLVLLVIMMLVAGVTFATLQSQAAVIQGNAIQTATASLQLSSNGTTYSSTMDGYVFGNLIPGGNPTPSNGYPVYVKNVGTSPLAPRLSVKGPIANPNNVDLTKVHVLLTPTSSGSVQNMTLAELVASNQSGGIAMTNFPRITPGQSVQYILQVSLEADAVNGPNGSIDNIDFTFGAVAVN